MDAAYNSVKKTVLSLATLALLVAAPAGATPAGTVVINPVLTNTTIQLGNSGCNQQQTLALSSTSGSIPLSVSIAYNPPLNSNGVDSTNGAWLYATVSDAALSANNHTTVGGTAGVGFAPFNTLIPDPTTVAPALNYINLTIGLNMSFGSLTETATVTLTPTGVGATPIVIIVNYAYNSACGGNNGSVTNGYITVTPGALTMTAAQGNSQVMQLGVQNNTALAMTFVAAPSTSTSPWLTSDSTSTVTVQPGATDNVNVTANATGLNVNTYTGTVTITPSSGVALQLTITFNVTAGTGTGGSGTIQLNGASTANQSFQYIASGTSATGPPSAACIAVTDSNSAVTSYGDSFTLSPAGTSWLNVNGSSFSPQTNQSFGSNGCLYVQPNNSAFSLTSGVYQATITVTDSSGSQATANITLFVDAGTAQNVTVTPSAVYAFPGVAAGATATESQQFTMTAQTPITLSIAQIQGSPSWLGISNQTGVATGTEQFTLTANPTGLATGVYFATVVTASSNPSGSTTILVSLTVGGTTTTCTSNCGGTVTSTVVPTALSFASEAGNFNWEGGGEAQAITVTGAAGTTWNSSVVYGSSGANWLLFGGNTSATGGTFGSSPAYLLVNIQPNNLAASSVPYTATITVTTPSGTTNVSVSLLVTPVQTHVLLASPALTTFTASNGSSVAPQNVIFSDSSQGFPGTAGSSPSISVVTSTTWLVATSVGNKMTLTASPTGLATGAYAGAVTVTSSTYPNSPLTYPVVFIVNGGTSAGPLTLSSSGLTFNATPGGSLPASQTLTVTAASSVTASVVVSEQNCATATWLTISPAGTFTASTTATPFTVSVNQSGVTAGSTCSGTLTFTSGSNTQTVNVSMVVAGTTGTANVTVTPSGTLSFSYTTGGNNPPTQNLVVSSASGSAGIPFTVSSNASWLTATPISATTQTTLTVTANPTGLTASSTAYAAVLTIQPTGGTTVTVNVTLAVAGAPVVSATPTTMTFAYASGGSNPPTQTISVTGGGAAAPFAVSTSSSGWLSVTPVCASASPCTTPNTGTFNLTVTANPTGMNAGTFNGSITIAGTGTATGTTIVNVTFTVTVPPLTITKVTNGASFATGTVSPGDIISLFALAANPIGPATAVQLNSTNCPSPCTSVPTTMGGVQVEFLPSGIYAPLTYVSATQINCVVPYEVATQSSISVEVKYLGQASNAFLLQEAPTSPGLFSFNGSGTGLAAMPQYDPTGTYQGINNVGNAASPGWVVTLYVTGEGTIPSPVTGAVTSAISVHPVNGPPTVLIDNQPATVMYYGEAYGFVSGLMQVNVLIPSGIHTSQADSISLTIGGNSTQAGTTVQIK